MQKPLNNLPEDKIRKMIIPKPLYKKFEKIGKEIARIDGLTKEDLRKEEAEQEKVFKNKTELFFYKLLKNDRPLKIYDQGCKPAFWTDVVFSEMQGYVWAFMAETEINKTNETDIFSFVSGNKDFDQQKFKEFQQTIKKKKLEKSTMLEYKTKHKIVNNESTIKIVKEWIRVYFPKFTNLDVVWDEKGLKKSMKALDEIIKKADKHFKNGEFIELDI